MDSVNEMVNVKYPIVITEDIEQDLYRGYVPDLTLYSENRTVSEVYRELKYLIDAYLAYKVKTEACITAPSPIKELTEKYGRNHIYSGITASIPKKTIKMQEIYYPDNNRALKMNFDKVIDRRTEDDRRADSDRREGDRRQGGPDRRIIDYLKEWAKDEAIGALADDIIRQKLAHCLIERREGIDRRLADRRSGTDRRTGLSAVCSMDKNILP